MPIPEATATETNAVSWRVLERILALSDMVAELGRCTSQHDLFHVMGRRLHDLGLESGILMLTPDQRSLSLRYIIAEDFWPESLRQMEHILSRPWFEIEFPLVAPSDLTASMQDGRIRLAASMLDDIEAMWPTQIAGRRDTIRQLFPVWRAIYAPLRQSGEIVGLLIIFSETLCDNDKDTLAAFANLLSAMLESVYRLEESERRNQQLALLSAVTREMNAAIPVLSSLINTVEAGLTSEPRFSRVRVGLLQSDELVFRAGGAHVVTRIPLNAPNYLARVARLGGSLRVSDLPPQRIVYYAPVAPQTRSLLVIPLLGGAEQNQPTGILCVENDLPNAFDQHDQATIEAFAAALVTALYNVRLYEYMDSQLARRLHEQDILLRIGQAVTRSLDPHSVFDKLLTLTVDALDAERGWLALIDEPADQIHINYTLGETIAGLRGSRPCLKGGAVDWMIQNHQHTVCIPDASIEGWYTSIFARWKYPPNSALLTLVMRHHQPVGVLSLLNKQHDTFNADDVRLAEAISLWASLALENAQLYQDSLDKQARLERGTARLAQALSSGHTLQDALNAVLDLSIDMTGADAGGVDLLGPEPDFLVGYASRHLAVSVQPLRVPLKGSIDEQALQSRRPVVWDDALANPDLVLREVSEAIQLRSVACVPLLGRRGPLGALVVFRQQVRPFNVEEVNLLVTFGQQAAVAIERAQLAEETRRQDARLKAVLENMREGALVINSNNTIEYANATARREFPALPEEGGQSEDLLNYLASDAERQYALQMGQRFLELGASPFELDTLNGAGTRRRIRVRASVIEPGERYLVLFVDVTDEHRLERLRQEFLRELHHEIRTPLTSITQSLEICLTKDMISGEDRDEALEIALQQARLVHTQLDELRSYTLLGEPVSRDPNQRADLRQIVSIALADTRRDHPGIQFRERLPRKALWIAYDNNSIYRAIRRLLDNAAKFSRPGGQVQTQLAAQDEFARLSIQDEGIGIAPDRLDEIFTPFHQLDDRIERKYRGVGLGLSLVRRVIEDAGGTVDAQSTPGQGSVFTLVLPLAR